MLVSCSARPSESATACAPALGIAEDMHRQTPDRAGDPVAIEVERRQVGGADVVRGVHLHAVDNGEEILAAQREARAPARARRGRQVPRPAGVERLDLVAPGASAALLLLRRAASSSAMSSTSRQNA